MQYDLIIIGLGPAGIKLAQEALSANLSVLAFEKEKAGGTCLNKGCIPTKSFLHLYDTLKSIKSLKKEGVLDVDVSHSISIEKLYSRKDAIVSKLSTAVKSALISLGLEIIEQECSLQVSDSNAVVVADNREYTAKNIVIASGSTSIELQGLKFNGKDILSSDDVLSLEKLPKSMAIVGSGAIGLEWARIFSSLGVDVSIVEKASNLLPQADFEISKRIERSFKIARIPYYLNSGAVSYHSCELVLDNDKKILFEKVLVAVGRKPLIPKLSDNYSLKINSDFTTNIDNLYVVGDALGAQMLAHNASSQASALFKRLYKNSVSSELLVPSVVYGTPEIASIGLREQDIDNIDEYKVYKMQLSLLPKAWCDGDIDGLFKVITKDEKILGAHIISKEASALISQIAIAIRGDLTVEDIKDIILPHPSYSEGILEVLHCE